MCVCVCVCVYQEREGEIICERLFSEWLIPAVRRIFTMYFLMLSEFFKQVSVLFIK